MRDAGRGRLLEGRALRDHPRNLTDDQLRALAQRGGVACLNVYPVFLVAEGEASLQHVLDHAERFLRVAGEDHVGLGCDYDGIGVTPYQSVRSPSRSMARRR